MEEQSIELDCAPGHPRPDTLIGDVISGTGLIKKEPTSTFFGEWAYNYDDVSPELWQKIKPILEKRITALYHSGKIRYGSW